jgi:hypothetical protein
MTKLAHVLLAVIAAAMTMALPHPASAAGTRSCQAVETIAFPTQVPQTFGCQVDQLVTACRGAGQCVWHARARIDGVGVVGARVRLFGSYTPTFFEGRCGPAAAVCEASATYRFRAYDEARDIFPERIRATCDWQGLAAVQLRLTCELRWQEV